MSDKKLTPYQIQNIIKERGDVRLSDLIEIVKKDKVHECPKCKGVGFHCVIENVYPSGLPDSGWAIVVQKVYDDCDLCEGFGYTKKRMRSVHQITGYEECEVSL